MGPEIGPNRKSKLGKYKVLVPNGPRMQEQSC